MPTHTIATGEFEAEAAVLEAELSEAMTGLSGARCGLESVQM